MPAIVPVESVQRAVENSLDVAYTRAQDGYPVGAVIAALNHGESLLDDWSRISGRRLPGLEGQLQAARISFLARG